MTIVVYQTGKVSVRPAEGPQETWRYLSRAAAVVKRDARSRPAIGELDGARLPSGSGNTDVRVLGRVVSREDGGRGDHDVDGSEAFPPVFRL